MNATLDKDTFPTVSIKVRSPSGTIFVHILENSFGKPVRILINVGKSGSELNAWTDSLARMVTMLLERDEDIFNIVEQLHNMTSDRANLRGHARSGPEALAKALLMYVNDKLGIDKMRGKTAHFGNPWW